MVIGSNPIKRRGAYPDQKPIHDTDLSYIRSTLAPGEQKAMQVDGRTVLYPVLKQVSHPELGMMWTDAIGDLGIFYDEDLRNVFIINMTNDCTLTIKFKIV